MASGDSPSIAAIAATGGVVIVQGNPRWFSCPTWVWGGCLGWRWP